MEPYQPPSHSTGIAPPPPPPMAPPTPPPPTGPSAFSSTPHHPQDGYPMPHSMMHHQVAGYVSPQPSKGSSSARLIILAVGIFLFIIPLFSILALTLLGSTVESEFVPVEPIEQIGSPAPADPVASPVLEEVIAPGDARLYVADSGAFTMAVPAAWPDPVIQPNPLSGLDSTFWFIDELSTDTFRANVNVARSRQAPDATLDSIVAAELNFTRSEFDIEDLQQRTRMINGDVVSELFFVANFQGIDLGFYSIIRLDGDIAHQVTLTTNVEVAAEAQLLLEPYLVTLDATG